MKNFFLLLIICLASFQAAAQTKVQRGVARMITRTAKDPIVPVKDVKVVVDNVASNGSDAQGRFSINVTANRDHSYKLSGVRLPKNSNLVLASPTLSDKCYLNAGNLILAFTTAEDKQREYKSLYVKLQKKYNQQRNELQQLRDQLKEQRIELKEGSAAYQRLTARIDSAQALLNQYFDEKQQENTTKELERIAEQLATTDYQSLEAEEADIYDLMKEGDWPTLSEYLLKLMNGDAAAYVQEAVDQKNAAKEIYEKTSQELAHRLKRIENAIESYKMQHLNDSVSRYYEILVRADSTNWNYLNQAGLFELQYKSQYEKGKNYFQTALRYAKEDTLLATTYNNLGSIFDEKDDLKRAIEYYQKALDINSRVYGKKSIGVASAYNNIGYMYKRLGDYPHSLEFYQKALKCWQQNYDKSHILRSGLLDVSNNIGYLYIDMGDNTRAEEYFLKVIDFTNNVKEPRREVANAYLGLGNIYNEKRDYAHAEEYMHKALEINLILYGEQSSHVALIYNEMGNIYLSKRELDSAEKYLKKALTLNISIYGENSSKVSTQYNNLGELYEKKGDYIRAEENLKRSLSIKILIFGNQHPKVAISYYNLGGVYEVQGDLVQAKNYYQKAYDLAKSVLGTDHKHTKKFKNNLESVNNRLKDRK